MKRNRINGITQGLYRFLIGCKKRLQAGGRAGKVPKANTILTAGDILGLIGEKVQITEVEAPVRVASR